MWICEEWKQLVEEWEELGGEAMKEESNLKKVHRICDSTLISTSEEADTSK